MTGSTLARDPVRNAEEGHPHGVAEREHGTVGVMAVADANRVVAEGHFDARDDNQLARCVYAVSFASGTAAIFNDPSCWQSYK